MPEVTSKVHSFLPQEEPGCPEPTHWPVHQDHWLGDPPFQEAGCRPPFSGRWGPSPARSLPPKVLARWPTGQLPCPLDPPVAGSLSLGIPTHQTPPIPRSPTASCPQAPSVPRLPVPRPPPPPAALSTDLPLSGFPCSRCPTAGPQPLA